MSKALLIFVKNAIRGQVKTRLAATVGDELAMHVYQQLLEHTRKVSQVVDVDKYVYYADFIAKEDTWSNSHFQKRVQKGNDLGDRMQHAFSCAFENGYEHVIIIGSDCPGIDEKILEVAFSYLKNYDVVIGPANDGGYYLLGMKKFYPQLFNNIAWSTTAVLNQTIAKCRELGIMYTALPLLHDVDEEKDLIHLKPLLL